LCQPDLLSRKEQLRQQRQQAKGAVDEHAGVEHQAQQEKAAAKTAEPDRARQSRPEPIRHAAAQ